MLFGQSIFQSVLTRLKQERDDDETVETEADFRIRGLGMGFVAATHGRAMSAATGGQAYDDFLPKRADIGPEPLLPEEDEPAPSPPPIPAHLLRLTTEEIAEELAITDQDTEAALAEKRRRFAKANHPDGVAPEFRDNANIRMKTANLLIDTAIKGRFWR